MTTETTAAEDVEMSAAGEQQQPAASQNKQDQSGTIEELKEHLRTIEKTLITRETHYILRILRKLPATRKKLNVEVLRELVEFAYGPCPSEKDCALSFFAPESPRDPRPRGRLRGQVMPEVDAYVYLLIILYLLDSKQVKEALMASTALVNKLLQHNSRSLDLLTAKALFYWYQSMEYSGEFVDLRDVLSLRLRTCTHNGDNEGVGVCLNLLLRYLLRNRLYEQAQKLIGRTSPPEQASNSQLARYLFYAGKVQAVRLQYTTAFNSLLLAIRKAPQQGAIGFRQIAYKYYLVVQLLMGEIPEKSIFRQADLKRCLSPYKRLVNAVRNGNISLFMSVLEEFRSQFVQDGILNLILRLRHNVIKAGVRMISMSYSRIPLQDIAMKLHLDSAEDAENIVSKAIRDGVILGVIHHRSGYLETTERKNIYQTDEPLKAFDMRIRFSMEIHTKSVQALRFPPKKYYDNLESSKERFEKEREALEYAKEIAEEEDEDFA